MDCVVEPIPEYTEEEEMRDEGRDGVPMGSPAADSGIYITTDSMAALRGTSEAGAYLSVGEMVKQAAKKDTYLTVDNMESMLMDTSGQYLTLERAQKILQEAGYLSLEDAQKAKASGGEWCRGLDGCAAWHSFARACPCPRHCSVPRGGCHRVASCPHPVLRAAVRVHAARARGVVVRLKPLRHRWLRPWPWLVLCLQQATPTSASKARARPWRKVGISRWKRQVNWWQSGKTKMVRPYR